jgi:hypothetical protein
MKIIIRSAYGQSGITALTPFIAWTNTGTFKGVNIEWLKCAIGIYWSNSFKSATPFYKHYKSL